MAVQITVLPDEIAEAFDREPSEMYLMLSHLVIALGRPGELLDFIEKFVPVHGDLQADLEREEASEIAGLLRHLAEILEAAVEGSRK